MQTQAQQQADGNTGSGDFWCAHALLPQGWARDVRIGVRGGRIATVENGVAAALGDQCLDIVVPGLGNLHSHAFQRGMAGLTEIGGRSGDSFWSWRELMYRFLQRLSPDDLQAIAEQAYVEMLEAGFTRVGEFHYVHHAADGRPYADRAEMAQRLAAAAQTSGIGMTLLPVFYAHADFGGAAPNPAQQRLLHDVDGFAALLDGSRRALQGLDDAVLGLAPHSLRAVTPDELAALLPLCGGPVHIHIAEQTREVDACLAWSGQRPVQWLLAHAPVDARWCLVHATHVDAAEVQGIAASGAVVGLCPITEANLGDGLFPMQDFLRAGGRFGVGSDSNVLIDAAEELRLLEYGQRLSLRGRNVLTGDTALSSGRLLFQSAAQGAAQALGVAQGLCEGAPADLVELDAAHPALQARDGDAWLDSWLFAARGGAVRSVWRHGRALVREGRHLQREGVAARYARALTRLLDA
ncbi:formimidoylglutamate deiminase [uncultured Xanthomonas sp.]|uniref:formimidoylglutamate deiminase n=1 Tax=uncultured Xanthomonas sp. TaxID=152831 RepID=UPI0025D86309|nr:formimidoylglutamate deiminase [uncultured Xanthomonas sp.]